jgi:hypothetical protein
LDESKVTRFVTRAKVREIGGWMQRERREFEDERKIVRGWDYARGRDGENIRRAVCSFEGGVAALWCKWQGT